MTTEGAALRVFGPLFRLFFRRVLLSSFGGSDARPLWVVDIDNTVAHTWPSFAGGHATEAQRLASLPPLEGMCSRVRAAGPSVKVLFLSVRPYGAYCATRRWLARQGLPAGLSSLALVESPAEKLRLLRLGLAANPGRDVEYYDDLSRGHETGSVEFYADLIAEARRLPLRYYGCEELAAINKL